MKNSSATYTFGLCIFEKRFINSLKYSIIEITKMTYEGMINIKLEVTGLNKKIEPSQSFDKIIEIIKNHVEKLLKPQIVSL